MNVCSRTIIGAKISRLMSPLFIIRWKKFTARLISRSRERGAASLAELATFALPALLIPYPYAADDHQTRNAEIFVRANAAFILKESDLTGDLLAKKIRELVERSRNAARHVGQLRRARAEKRGRFGRRNDGKIQPADMTPSPPDLICRNS